MDPRLTGLPKDANGGSILKDRYVIERELGRGGIGVVYLARDRQLLSRPVVVKVLLDTGGRGEWVKKKFRHEIEALARIDHPGVVGVLDAGSMPDGSPFLVMQYVEGATLRSILAAGRMPLDRIGRICRQIGSALAAAHEKGVYHRDLKPDNVMVQTHRNGEDHVKLIDFGIATVKDTDRLDANTAATTVAGTVLYMAPEQLMGKPSGSSDIYALGVIAYEAITGRLPFLPETPYQMPELQRRGVEVPPSRLRAGLPPEADAAVLRALSYDPAERYASAREFGDDLASMLSGLEASGENTRRHGGAATGRARPETFAAMGLGGEGADDAGTRAGGLTVREGGDDTYAHGSTSPVRRDRGLDDTDLIQPAGATTFPATTAEDEPPARRAWASVLLAVLVVSILTGGGILWASRRVVTPDPQPTPTPPVTTDPAPPAPIQELAYFITVQKYRNGRPFQAPFRLTSEINFEKDYRVRLTVASPREGRLYVLNESPPSPDGATELVLLFPSSTANSASSLVPAGVEIAIPEQSWFAFDAQDGTERLWLVWSAEPVPELESLGPANPAALGAISNAEQLARVRAFLSRHEASKPEVVRDDARQRTIIRGPGAELVHLLRLEHH